MEQKKNTYMMNRVALGLGLIIILGSYYFLFFNNENDMIIKTPIDNTNSWNISETPNIDTNSWNTLETPVDETSDWKNFSDTEYWFSFKYPNNFFDIWHEPKTLIGECNYQVFPDVCPDINNIVTDLPTNDNWTGSIAEKLTINNTPYCLYNYKDAATGHVFNHDYYMTVVNQKCLIIPLETSTTNCDFYLPIEIGNTEQQNNYANCIIENKNQPLILDKIISTFKFEK